MTGDKALMAERFVEALDATALYAKPVAGLVDALAEKMPAHVTQDVIDAAVHIIVTTHASGAFPKVPASIRAIEEAQKRRILPPSASTSGGITKEAYAERAAAHARAGKAVQISAETDRAAWDEWANYFTAIGMKYSGDQMRERRALSWTVPTTLPQNFDLYWQPGTNPAAMRRASDYDDEVRQIIAETTRQCVAMGIDPLDFAARRPVLAAILRDRRPQDREVKSDMREAA